jgi:hypothetical protein
VAAVCDKLMTLPIAHAGHWLVNLLYLAPLVFVIAALGWQSLRDRRRGTGPRSEPSDTPPPV